MFHWYPIVDQSLRAGGVNLQEDTQRHLQLSLKLFSDFRKDSALSIHFWEYSQRQRAAGPYNEPS